MGVEKKWCLFTFKMISHWSIWLTFFEKSWRIQTCPSPASQKGVVASSSSCCKDSPAAVVPSLKTSALASQRRGEYLGRGKDVKEVSESHIEWVKMTTHYFNSKLTVTSGQRLCHSLSIRIQQDVTLRPQKSPLIWLGCCSQKVDGHSCSDPTSYSLFTLILPNLHQNRSQIAYLDSKEMLCIEKNSMVCPALPFRSGGFDGPLHRSFIQQDQEFSTQNTRTLRTRARAMGEKHSLDANFCASARGISWFSQGGSNGPGIASWRVSSISAAAGSHAITQAARMVTPFCYRKKRSHWKGKSGNHPKALEIWDSV